MTDSKRVRSAGSFKIATRRRIPDCYHRDVLRRVQKLPMETCWQVEQRQSTVLLRL